MIWEFNTTPDMTTATAPNPYTTFGPTYALSDDPQVFEFTAYPLLGIVSVCRWHLTLINGHQHRKMTGQFRYSTENARKLWSELKDGGARPFTWAA